MQFDTKSKTLGLFFVFFYVPTIALLLLVHTSVTVDYIVTTFYVILALVSLVVLGTMLKSDDQYYRAFTLNNLVYAVITAALMVLFSWGLSFKILNNPSTLSAVNPINLLPASTSIISSFAVVLISGLVLAATSEELFKLAIFAEAKERWGKNGYKIGKITVPGIFIYVGLPVGFWSLLHSVQAYQFPIMVIPAFVNGVILIIYLWKTKCIIGAIFAHFGYNGLISLLLWTSGNSGLPAGTPIVPNIFSPQYWSTAQWCYDLLVLILIVGAVAFFLVPSLTNRDSGQRKR